MSQKLLSDAAEIDEWFRLNIGPHFSDIPKRKGSAGSLEQLTLQMQLEFERHWREFPLTFADCNPDLRRNKFAMRVFASNRPRELRNADSEWLKDSEALAELFSRWHRFDLRTTSAHRKILLKWTKFFFQPLDTDLWFWGFHFNLYDSNDRPKSLDTDTFRNRVNETQKFAVTSYLKNTDKELFSFVKKLHDGEPKDKLVSDCFRSLVYSENFSPLITPLWIAQIWKRFVSKNGDIGKHKRPSSFRRMTNAKESPTGLATDRAFDGSGGG